MRFDCLRILISSTAFLILGSSPILCQTSSKGTASTPVPSTGPIKTMEQLDDKTPISIGDQLTFRILEDEDPPVSLIITDSGQVQIPYVGNVVAVNKTPRALALEVRQALEGRLYNKATVLISLEKRSVRSPGRVYLTGEVARQGPLELPGDERLTVSRAIIQAGGFGDFANKRKVKLVRKTGTTQQIEIIDVAEIINKGRLDLDRVLQPGDVILVPARLINW
jgi:protein involved in polysaccharide export with SLBB domain